MTRRQIIEEFHNLNQRVKVSLLRELLDKEISDEMRKDISDYLIAMEAKKEGGYTPLDVYHRKRMAKIAAKKTTK